MPYIKQEDRPRLVQGGGPNSPGELNFIISFIVREYLSRKGERYQTYNEVIGALECAKLELYRRRVAGYEDEKIEEHGDLY